jgi:hypothetical protein
LCDSKLFNSVIAYFIDFGLEKFKKTSTVIQKVPKTMKSDEFRSINKLPVYEKAMDSVIKAQLSAFIDENNILIEQLSGFRKSHSCGGIIEFGFDI